jgi:hypothetical protein
MPLGESGGTVEPEEGSAGEAAVGIEAVGDGGVDGRRLLRGSHTPDLTRSITERFACRVLGQHRSTQRKVPRGRVDEDALTDDIIALASQYGRYGHRRITALLREAGWVVNVKRVEGRAMVRHWSEDNGERRREGLKVPGKQPKKCRLWLNVGSCKRPHSSTGYRPPAPEVISWPASPSGATSPATPAVARRHVMHQD